MPVYTCPTCGEKMERDLLLFTKHTDEHIVTELKRLNPNWVTKDGYCQKCLNYFKTTFGKTGTLAASPAGASRLFNLGERESRKRFLLGLIGLGAGLAFFFWMRTVGAPKAWYGLLFFPILGGLLGFFQSSQKLCVVLAGRGVRNMDNGETALTDASQLEAIRRKSSRMIMLAVTLALLVTVAALLSGCETVKGVGRDIEGASSSVQKAMGSSRQK